MKDAILDFSAQMGQTPDNYLRRLILMGGDGLTFLQILQRQKYLQFYDFKSVKMLVPVLEWFLTSWTNFTRLVERHWGPSISTDPSTLGHSARKILRKTPRLLADAGPCSRCT